MDYLKHLVPNHGFERQQSPFPRAVPELDSVCHAHIDRTFAQPQQYEGSKSMCVMVPRRGGQRFLLNGRWYVPAGGDLLVIPPGVPVSTGGELTTRIDAYELYAFLDHRRPFLGNPQWEPLRQSLKKLPICQVKAPSGANRQLRDLYQLVKAKRDALTIVRVMADMASFLLTVLDAVGHQRRSRKDDYVTHAAQYMRMHLDERLTIEDLTKHVGYGRSALIEGFRREFGIPPMEWFVRMKIQRSAELLKQTDRSISSISTMFGFSSSQNFATTFKKFMSVSPTAFRRQNSV